MPIGPYKDWDECIRAARAMDDVDDPERYCGALERDATQGSAMSTHVVLLAPEGVKTSDRRFIEEGALTWRDPITMHFSDKEEGSHVDSAHVGNVTNVRRARIDGETWTVGDLTYDSDAEAREAQRLADEGKISGVSVRILDASATVEVLEVDEFGNAVDWLETTHSGEIGSVTQLTVPAFKGARIMSAAEFNQLAEAPLVAAANPRAKANWFTDPQLPGPTPLTVTDEGRIYGHLATWGTCHIGYDGVCVTPPTSETEYAYFNLGTVKVDGEEIHVGHITLGTGHAQLSADAQAATEHYDHTGSVVADIAAGEDEHGVWVAGAARPGADLDVLRSASLSGDWRRVDGNLELVAALAVNVPGFPIPRIAASVAHGDQMALVASGVVEHRDREDLIYEALRLLTEEVRMLRANPDQIVNAFIDRTVEDAKNEQHMTAEQVGTAIGLDTKGRIAAVLDS